MENTKRVQEEFHLYKFLESGLVGFSFYVSGELVAHKQSVRKEKKIQEEEVVISIDRPQG